MKFIVLLRDPVERAYSAWNMYHGFIEHGKFADLYDPRTFDEAVDEELELLQSGKAMMAGIYHYVRRGIYYEQLVRFFDGFGRDQVLVLGSEFFRDDTVQALNAVIGFLDLPPITWNLNVVDTSMYRGEYSIAMSRKTRSKLRMFYESRNERLFGLIGREFAWQ